MRIHFWGWVLTTATIVKMSQNLLIIPISLVLTWWCRDKQHDSTRSYKVAQEQDTVSHPVEISPTSVRTPENTAGESVPLFPATVISTKHHFLSEICNWCYHHLKEIAAKFPRFILGFIITSAISSLLPSSNRDIVIRNSFVLAEWISLVGFVLIGYELDITTLNYAMAKVLLLYFLTQTVDIATTFGWSKLVMTL